MSEKLYIFHNPSCSKSCAVLSILNDLAVSVEIVDYMKNPPKKEILLRLIQLLGIYPSDLVRKNEKLYKEKFEVIEIKEDEWIDILAKNPILLQRPIILYGDKALIARPPEKILELFKS